MKIFVRVTSVLVVLFCATIAAWASYTHILDLAELEHQSPPIAWFYPITVDGLIYGASMLLLDRALRGKGRHPLAICMLVLGIIVTAVANVWADARYGPGAAIVSAWPVLPLVAGYEMLMALLRERASDPDVPDMPDETATLVSAAVAGENAVPSVAPPAIAAAIPEPRPAPPVEETEPPKRARHAKGHPTLYQVEQTYYKQIQAGEVPSLTQIKRDLSVGNEKALQYQVHIREKGRAARETVR